MKYRGAFAFFLVTSLVFGVSCGDEEAITFAPEETTTVVPEEAMTAVPESWDYKAWTKDDDVRAKVFFNGESATFHMVGYLWENQDQTEARKVYVYHYPDTENVWLKIQVGLRVENGQEVLPASRYLFEWRNEKWEFVRDITGEPPLETFKGYGLEPDPQDQAPDQGNSN